MNRNKRWRNIMLVGIGLLALLFMFSGKSLLPPSFTASPEVKKYAQNTLVVLDDAGLEQILAKNAGKPTLLFVYASWCPYCKKQFPMLKALQARYPQEQLAIEYIALDKDAYDLSRFLMDTYPQLPFTPYHVTVDTHPVFDAALENYGFTPDGAIPHLLLFNGKKQPVKEFKGLTPIADLREAIQPLL